MKKKIAIQGFEGSFHQKAAIQFYGQDIELICCATFNDVIKNAKNNPDCDGAVMAIENSVAGSILANYNLVANADLQIVGEVYMYIDQNLLVNPGVQLEDITEVHSHPMALRQCIEYLTQFPWKLVETEDTALSAARIHESGSKNIAGIAGSLAAELFELEVLAPKIQTAENNYTRFWVLQKGITMIEAPNKASMVFYTDHSIGSLGRVLNKIAEHGINLSKLQSYPILGSDWEYQFHADCEFANIGQWEQMLSAIRPYTASLKVYGVYRNGKIEAK